MLISTFLQDLEATIKEIAEKFHTSTIVGFVEAVLNRCPPHTSPLENVS